MRKKIILTTLICLIFIVCLVLSLCLLFSVKQIDAVYSASVFADGYVDDINETLKGFKGKNLLFLKTEQIKEKLEKYTYFDIKEVKKSYPNKIVVELEERKEVYAVKAEQGYVMVSDNGTVLATRKENKNNIDGVPNVLLSDFTVDECVNGQKIKVKEENYFEILQKCASEFTKIRDMVYSVEINTEGGREDFVFSLYSGAKLVIGEVEDNPEVKVKEGIKHLNSLDDFSKTYGYVYVYILRESGLPQAVWTENYV